MLLAAGMLPSAYAAGLGRLTVQSALGQPLQAEVEITALSREEVASLSVRMAPQAAFRQAGLEYNPVLRNLRLTIERRADGTPFIRLTSAQPVNEPFVDMMVELNWASGRFVREYTFLLDPPELRVAQPEPQEAPAQIVAPAVPAPAASAPAAPADTVAEPPVAAAPSSTEQAAPAAESQQAPASAESASAAPATAAPATSVRTVEVVRGDSLSGIAGRVQPEGVTLAQTMLAIYRANP
ncbi:MAG: pilus assembly protein FimV, partial [Burkholderiales bacterium]